jgi:hypothetical protein
VHIRLLACIAAFIVAACSAPHTSGVTPGPAVGEHGTLARVLYWRAKPGKFAEYTRYVRDVAEPIDHEAQRHGAFLSVTTYVARDTTGPWTHMRIFVLRDSAQLAGLSAALDAAGVVLEPDSTKRRMRSEYSATLRDAAGNVILDVLR